VHILRTLGVSDANVTPEMPVGTQTRRPADLRRQHSWCNVHRLAAHGIDSAGGRWAGSDDKAWSSAASRLSISCTAKLVAFHCYASVLDALQRALKRLPTRPMRLAPRGADNSPLRHAHPPTVTVRPPSLARTGRECSD
jgi:hypothetical protein